MQLPIDIDKTSGIPIYVQLGEQIRLLVRRGALRAGDAMPTVRSLAVDLGINANTVARVYRDLQREGWLRLERGIGTFVADAGDDRAVDASAFSALNDASAALVSQAREVGLQAGELVRLIENLWQEERDA